MRRYIILLLLVFAIQYVFTSCKKFVDIPIPKNQLTTEAQFQDSLQATSAILGMYVYMMKDFGLVSSNGGVTVYTGLSSDEIYPTQQIAEEDQIVTNSIASNNYVPSTLWSYPYSIIYQANACIGGVTKSSSLSNSLKTRLIAECKFIRAFQYFNLVNLFGDVPLITTTDFKTNQSLGRESTSVVYKAIIDDLLDAKNSMSTGYITTGKLRPNAYTIDALLAKVYLYMNNWAQAESEASTIINSGSYGLETNLNSVFTPNSNETIFELQIVLTSRATIEGFYFVPSTSGRTPNYVLTNYLMNSFESGDQRRVIGNWVKSNTINGQTLFYPYKYKQRTNPSAENYKIFRLAEQYLIRAEAKAQQNTPQKLIEAVADINMIRQRAGLLPLPTSLTQQQILDAIMQERRVELFCEWGNRWFDLKRWNKASTVLAPIKSAWKNTAILYPIPITEITLNSNLLQNAGY